MLVETPACGWMRRSSKSCIQTLAPMAIASSWKSKRGLLNERRRIIKGVQAGRRDRKLKVYLW